MSCAGDEVLSSIGDKIDAFPGPTFRYGLICEMLKTMNVADATKIRGALNKKYKEINSSIRSYFKDSGYTITKYILDRPENVDFEGPAIKFPKFVAKIYNNIKVEISATATVCLRPKHSKIWVKISYSDDNKELNTDELNEFMSQAEAICKVLSDIIKTQYEKVLKENGIINSINVVRFLKIETISEDLSRVVPKLELGQIRIEDMLEKEYELLKWIISRSYKKRVISISDYEEMSSDYKWFRAYSNCNKYIGIYIKQHNDEMKQTNFIGVVHCPSEDLHKACIGTNELSKKLVNHIAPMI